MKYKDLERGDHGLVEVTAMEFTQNVGIADMAVVYFKTL
jgi:hypothetical protein